MGKLRTLIADVVTMDNVGQIHFHRLTSQDEGLIKKAKLKDRRKDPKDENGEEP